MSLDEIVAEIQAIKECVPAYIRARLPCPKYLSEEEKEIRKESKTLVGAYNSLKKYYIKRPLLR